ncbi:uncharacterized protein E6C27_scaffold1204G00040 [Cucumis melo var. makuwa]|uniref:Transposase n=1 Tax=Cucumis melo var. makuwa TaxID=1194695 RepID=A0A5A7SLI7_CUCMM|nr:uncharacterized protein E6C27_scaffold1204G00040 [Cucumis melo var. makuwa]
MKHEKIHACRNDCCLFRKELSDANVCPSCGMSRWKIPKNSKKEVKNVPVKVMWYFSPIPRFERMFRSKETSKLLTWHDRKREVNDLLQHPKDALSWKKIDNLWPEFGSEPRNLRLALSTDGVNPHGDLSSRYVRLAIIRLCFFFNAICKKTIDTSQLKGMQEDVVVTLCLLEKYFPPSFFTIMVHLVVHLVREIEFCGPVHLRPSKKQLDQAHLYVIQNVALALEVPKNSITPSLRWIAHGPSLDVATYYGYIINGYYYQTKRRDDIRRVQNSGVSIIATTMQVSSSKDKNPVMSDMTFYGDELVATNKNEDILTDALGSKEHGGRVRGVGAFVSQSQYFNTVKGKEKMCHKEEDDSRCKGDKKRSNHSRSSIGSTNIDLDADEDTPTNKGVEGTPCQLSIGSINNIVAVAMIVEDNIGCPNVKVLVDVEHSTRKDVVYPSNYIDVNGIIKLLNRHAMNNMEDVDMIHIPMNELIFGNDKFVYLAREDLLHYCDMVEIGYMCILAYITCLWDKCDCAKNFFVIDQSKISSHINQLEAVNLEQKVLIPYNTGFHWMLHVIDLRENCVYILDSLWSKVNEDIHGVINVGLKTWQAKHDLQCYRSTPKWRPVKCPRQLDSVGCRYYVQKYIHEIVHNSSTSITNLFNTKNAYRQEEIDEIRTEWAAFVSRFV